jgi:hypothetical protein
MVSYLKSLIFNSADAHDANDEIFNEEINEINNGDYEDVDNRDIIRENSCPPKISLDKIPIIQAIDGSYIREDLIPNFTENNLDLDLAFGHLKNNEDTIDFKLAFGHLIKPDDFKKSNESLNSNLPDLLKPDDLKKKTMDKEYYGDDSNDEEEIVLQKPPYTSKNPTSNTSDFTNIDWLTAVV